MSMYLTDIMDLEGTESYKQDEEVEARVRALHRYLRNIRKRGGNEVLADDVQAILGLRNEKAGAANTD